MAVKLKSLFPFWEPLKKIMGPFAWVFIMVLILYFPFLRPWWWLFAPVLLVAELKVLYTWWMNWDYSYAKIKWIVLEVSPPKELLVPLKAMEDVFAMMWGPLYDSPNWRERMMEGTMSDAPGWMSWEIVSTEGQLHFYIRLNASYRSALESALYAHYPMLEIREVPDYTKDVPQNIPNEDWEAYGEDYLLAKNNAIPIRTYEKTFEQQGEKIADEEKRLDPISSLLESMSKLGSGEHFWLQFTIMAVDKAHEPDWPSISEKLQAKIAHRSVKAPKKTFFGEISDIAWHLIVGPTKEGDGDKAKFKFIQTTKSESDDRELVLSPSERELLTEVERKAQKPVFRTNIRGVYLAKRENFKSGHKILGRIYFGHFQGGNFNEVTFSRKTRGKVAYIFRKQRVLARTRRLFKNYIMRFPPMFPERRGECAIMNSEELATLYHFPAKITGMIIPTMTSTSKKGSPPPNLPFE